MLFICNPWNKRMRCLTVRQPWAWAIIHGTKRIENRSRPIHYRGPLLIHAGLSRSCMTPDVLARVPGASDEPELDYGTLVGVVELVDCVPVSEVSGQPYADGPWCWMLRDPRPVARVKWKGSLGLFMVPDDRIEYLTPTRRRPSEPLAGRRS